MWFYHDVDDEAASSDGASEKVPVENLDHSSAAAGSSAEPQQALSLVCDEWDFFQ